MKKQSSWLMAGSFAAATALAVAPASAAPITVDGVTFGTGSNLQTTTIWENTVLAPGDILTGIGRVDVISSPTGCGGICWQNGNNSVELTFTFSYVLEQLSFFAGIFFA